MLNLADQGCEISSSDSGASLIIKDRYVYRFLDDAQFGTLNSYLQRLPNLSSLSIQENLRVDDKEIADLFQNKSNVQVLKQKKIEFISYPHEWCASMFKDAAILHLQLMQQLLEYNLYLKDCHPWNILFENTKPVFVDILSIVDKNELVNQKWLTENIITKSEIPMLTQLLSAIFETMFIPYFLRPLNGYAYGKPMFVKQQLLQSTPNSSTSLMNIRGSFPSPSSSIKAVKNLFGVLAKELQCKLKIRKLRNNKDFAKFLQDMVYFVQDIPVSQTSSDYLNYYDEKNENFDFSDISNWNDKQKSVYRALNYDSLNTVLDIGCNTGWFSIMAEKLRKQVVAFDCDESCVDSLYLKARKENLNILPLIKDINSLFDERYSIYDGKPVVLNAFNRYKCDAVIALGVIHHFILGLGLTVDDIISRLAKLANSTLVLEYVSLDDEKIVKYPDFFPAFYQNQQLARVYNLENIICELKKHFTSIEQLCSSPDTRSMLVCKK